MATRRTKSQPVETIDAGEPTLSEATGEAVAESRAEVAEPEAATAPASGVSAASGAGSASSSLEASYQRKKSDAEARLRKTDQDIEKLENDYKAARAKLVDRKQGILREIGAIQRDFRKRQSEQSEKKLTEFVRGLIDNGNIDPAALGDPALRAQMAELLKKAVASAGSDQAGSRPDAEELSSAAD
jgi:flagellar motility protein MotE (MotC chaperone)